LKKKKKRRKKNKQRKKFNKEKQRAKVKHLSERRINNGFQKKKESPSRRFIIPSQPKKNVLALSL